MSLAREHIILLLGSYILEHLKKILKTEITTSAESASKDTVVTIIANYKSLFCVNL
jgi:hypothetical protein